MKVIVGDNVKFTVTLKNSNDNPLKGKTVSIIYKESGKKACEEKDTDENGVYTCIADSPANYGTYEYGFTVKGQKDTSKTIKVTYEPKEEEDDFSESEFKAPFGSKETSDESPKLTVNVGDKVTFTVKLNNSSGNPVKGKTVSIISDSDKAQGCSAEDKNQTGVYTCEAKSPEDSGTYE